MGLLDSMFGGGTKLDLTLDTTTSSPGSVIGGKVMLTGGQKPLRLTELKVSLLFVKVQTKEGQALPDIDARVVTHQVVAAGGDIPAGSQQVFTFRLTVPSDLPPTAHNISFNVVANADIPGVKDPSAKQDLKVVEATKDKNHRLPLAEIEARFPNLRSQNEDQLCDALYDFFLACYSEGAQLMEAEPVVGWYIQNGSTAQVRRKALEAWANLVDNRVERRHLEMLYAVANTPALDDETFEQVIVAATKFAEEGALNLVQQLAQNPSAEIREKVASNLRFNAASKFNGKRELLVQLAQDQAPSVRRAAIGALADFNDDQQLMYWVANISDADPDQKVTGECLSTLALAHYHGLGDLTLKVYEKHVANPNAAVRSKVADQLGSQPEAAAQRVWGLAQRLAQDPDEEVRRTLAFQFCNMYRLPQLLPIAQGMAQNDPSEEVRREALGSMSSLMQPKQAAALYSQLFAQARSEEEIWPLVRGLRHHSDDKDVKKVLSQIGQSPYENVANAAREALS
ncbi:MAG TPA: HEAT repeat domain-containing protein [Polyangiaceae bacterium]